jgi:hypothetical protein
MMIYVENLTQIIFPLITRPKRAEIKNEKRGEERAQAEGTGVINRLCICEN